MSTHTVRLHRVLRSTPEKIYSAFLNAEAMAKWLPPYGFTCKVEHLDAKVGGSGHGACYRIGNVIPFGVEKDWMAGGNQVANAAHPGPRQQHRPDLDGTAVGQLIEQCDGVGRIAVVQGHDQLSHRHARVQ